VCQRLKRSQRRSYVESGDDDAVAMRIARWRGRAEVATQTSIVGQMRGSGRPGLVTIAGSCGSDVTDAGMLTIIQCKNPLGVGASGSS
jgi:hypothetical protein